jgi:hypothetical protein
MSHVSLKNAHTRDDGQAITAIYCLILIKAALSSVLCMNNADVLAARPSRVVLLTDRHLAYLFVKQHSSTGVGLLVHALYGTLN